MKNKKKSSEKDVHNLRQLLRENILSTSSNSKIQLSKPGQNKNKSNPKNSCFSMLKYKPKRLINFKGITIPLPSLGKASLDYSKTFGPENISRIKKSPKINVFNSKTIITKNKNNIDELIKDENLIEFKNIYILKYAQYSNNFSKFHQNKELITDARKRDFEDLYRKISKSLETQSQLLLNDIDNITQTNEINDIFVHTYTNNSPTNNLKNNFNFDKNKDNNLNNRKKILGMCADFSYYVIKFMLLIELR